MRLTLIFSNLKCLLAFSSSSLLKSGSTALKTMYHFGSEPVSKKAGPPVSRMLILE